MRETSEKYLKLMIEDVEKAIDSLNNCDTHLNSLQNLLHRGIDVGDILDSIEEMRERYAEKIDKLQTIINKCKI